MGRIEDPNHLINIIRQRFGYLTDSEEEAVERIRLLSKYTGNLDESYKIYNGEKKRIVEDYEKFISMYSFFNTYYYHGSQLEMEKISSDHDNVGVIKLERCAF